MHLPLRIGSIPQEAFETANVASGQSSQFSGLSAQSVAIFSVAVLGLVALGALFWTLSQESSALPPPPMPPPSIVLEPVDPNQQLLGEGGGAPDSTRPDTLPNESPQIDPVAPLKSGAKTPQPDPQAPPVTLALADSYREGEHMKLTVTAHQAGYLYVGALWANGETYLLYPNLYHPLNGENQVAAGQQLRLPGDLPPMPDRAVVAYPIYFPKGVSGPRAQEAIFAFITVRPLELPEVDADLGPAFRRLGIIQDKEAFRHRGPKPALQFKNWSLPLPSVPVVIETYTLNRQL